MLRYCLLSILILVALRTFRSLQHDHHHLSRDAEDSLEPYVSSYTVIPLTHVFRLNDKLIWLSCSIRKLILVAFVL